MAGKGSLDKRNYVRIYERDGSTFVDLVTPIGWTFTLFEMGTKSLGEMPYFMSDVIDTFNIDMPVVDERCLIGNE